MNDAEAKLDKAAEILEQQKLKTVENDKKVSSLEASLKAVEGERDRLTTLLEKLGKKGHTEEKTNPK